MEWSEFSLTSDFSGKISGATTVFHYLIYIKVKVSVVIVDTVKIGANERCSMSAPL